MDTAKRTIDFPSLEFPKLHLVVKTKILIYLMWLSVCRENDLNKYFISREDKGV